MKRYDQAQYAIEIYQLRNTEDARSWKLLGEVAIARNNPEAAMAFFDTAALHARWNDLGITRGQIETLLILKNTGELEARKPEIDALIAAFEDAIVRNAHFIALSSNVEEYLAITALLAAEFPAEAPRYQVRAARVAHQARLEREKTAARPPGFLW